MRRRVDTTPDSDLDNVANVAVGIAEKIREQDTRRLFDELEALCRWQPAKAAQLIMTFAAWFDTDTSVRKLWERVAAITADRSQVGAA